MISVPFQNPLAITLDNTNQAIRVSLLCAEMSSVSSGPQGTETLSNYRKNISGQNFCLHEKVSLSYILTVLGH